MVAGWENGQRRPSRLWSSGGMAERVDDAVLELDLLLVRRREA